VVICGWYPRMLLLFSLQTEDKLEDHTFLQLRIARLLTKPPFRVLSVSACVLVFSSLNDCFFPMMTFHSLSVACDTEVVYGLLTPSGLACVPRRTGLPMLLLKAGLCYSIAETCMPHIPCRAVWMSSLVCVCHVVCAEVLKAPSASLGVPLSALSG
jgi:hypothetical protein